MTTSSPKKASHQDWHKEDVKAALRKKNITLKALADQHGLTSSSPLSAALERSYPINERRIADALGLHPKDIWPSRYFEDGSRRPQGSHALKSTCRSGGRNGNARVGV